jgi:hypothetical protein
MRWIVSASFLDSTAMRERGLSKEIESCRVSVPVGVIEGSDREDAERNLARCRFHLHPSIFRIEIVPEIAAEPPATPGPHPATRAQKA